MGFLVEGTPLSWKEATEPNAAGSSAVDLVREHGIQQFVHLFKRLKDGQYDNTVWGDEVEFTLLHFDHEARKVTLSLSASRILHETHEAEQQLDESGAPLVRYSWKPEYGDHMVEGTPQNPYLHIDLVGRIEDELAAQRVELARFLGPNDTAVTLTMFPHMGVGNFTTPSAAPGGPVSHSLFVPDRVINSHVRFRTLTANIRERRQAKVCIVVPLFMDERTQPIMHPENVNFIRELGPLSGLDNGCFCQLFPLDVARTPPIARMEHRRSVQRHLAAASPTQLFYSDYLKKITESACCRELQKERQQKQLQQQQSKHSSPEKPLAQCSVVPPRLSHLRVSANTLPSITCETIPPQMQSFIYMDCMAFGMGSSCLQCTFQSTDINEARHLYDQLGVMCPIMLALSAATPVFRGYLGDMDVRWHVISASVDDRTPVERGIEVPEHLVRHALSGNVAALDVSSDCHNITDFRQSPAIIPKSRYDSISYFISPYALLKETYNDIHLVFDRKKYCQLKTAGLDRRLARHFAHLFVRDPLVIHRERLNLDDERETDHFENIQSTNWQTMRFKPPPPNSPIGWRVEFRVLELQFTDFENAAYEVFVVLLARAILHFNLNLYIPISRVDMNMARSHVRNSVLKEKFFFRRQISSERYARQRTETAPFVCRVQTMQQPPSSAMLPADDCGSPCPQISGSSGEDTPIVLVSPSKSPTTTSTPTKPSVGFEGGLSPTQESMSTDPSMENLTMDEVWHDEDDGYEEMTVAEILLGKPEFPGLIHYVKQYVATLTLDPRTKCRINRYLRLLEGRATGKIMTTATWIRHFVMTHPKYNRDSVVNDEILYDLMMTAKKITDGELECPELLGDLQKPPHCTGASVASS